MKSVSFHIIGNTKVNEPIFNGDIYHTIIEYSLKVEEDGEIIDEFFIYGYGFSYYEDGDIEQATLKSSNSADIQAHQNAIERLSSLPYYTEVYNHIEDLMKKVEELRN